jgi:predicted DNA-binding transcriptional regulator AlpA
VSVPKKFLDVEELADFLRMETSWIYDRTGPSASPDERIPHFKLGKYLRFDPESEEFKKWMQAQFTN